MVGLGCPKDSQNIKAIAVMFVCQHIPQLEGYVSISEVAIHVRYRAQRTLSWNSSEILLHEDKIS